MPPLPCLARTLKKVAALFVLCGLAATAALHAESRYIWWEAEDFDDSANVVVQEHDPEDAYGRVLSEHTLIEAQNSDTDAPKLSATYTVFVPHQTTWNLWVRKFWRHGPFKWRFAGNDWQTCGRDIALHSDSYIEQFIGTNWVFLGQVDLTAGTHTFEVESLDNKGFFDCFLLIDGPFQPAGRLKPGMTSGNVEPGHFAWEPPADPFKADSAIDLRFLNEPEAGSKGRVRRDGDGFVYGDGSPARFWMTQAGNLMIMKPPMVDVHARRLAKYGVNMARFDFQQTFRIWRSGDRAAFEAQLDRIHYAVSALKNEGVYLYFGHLFWDTHVIASSDDDLPGLKKDEKATGAMFVNEALQQKYLEWVRDLMTPINPYTGLSMAEDPAIAILEVMNESNLLFWTMNPNQLAPHTRELLETAFGKFAIERYGSIGRAVTHWGDTIAGDQLEGTQAGLLTAWHLTSQAYNDHPRRAADQIEFLTGLQFDLYARMKAAFREIGIQSLIAGSNWKTADPSTLGPLEHHSYTAVDMICRNEYFAPVLIEDARSWAVDQGDVFGAISALKAPEAAGPLMINSLVDMPYLITENNWNRPSPYRVEWPFLVATYGRVAGVDAWSFFSYDSPMWINRYRPWDISSPIIMGQFPAYALMYRRGDVSVGEPAVHERRPLRDLINNQAVALPEIQFKDEVWKKQLGGDPTVEFESKVNPRAFLVGPVRLDLSADEPSLETAELEKFLDEDAKIIRNTNGQLVWDYGTGIARVDTPTAQGAAGFLGEAEGILAFSNVGIVCRNDYGAVIVVSLDGKPLDQSRRILIQAGTTEQPYGYRTEPAGDAERIVSLGGYPMNVEKINAQVTLKGMAGHTVTALDQLGYPTNTLVQVRDRNGDLQIQLPADTLYTLVEAP
ncbi:MAG: hypothetical protein ACFB20_07615 [Opitutales bacterium]